VISVGIFLTPAEMSQALGSPFWVLAVWLAVGATALCGALCFGELLFVGLTVAGLYRLPRPVGGGYRVPGYPVTPLGFLALLATLLALLGAGRPKEAVLGVAMVALGIPVYLFLVAPRRRQTLAGSLEES